MLIFLIFLATIGIRRVPFCEVGDGGVNKDGFGVTWVHDGAEMRDKELVLHQSRMETLFCR